MPSGAGRVPEPQPSESNGIMSSRSRADDGARAQQPDRGRVVPAAVAPYQPGSRTPPAAHRASLRRSRLSSCLLILAAVSLLGLCGGTALLLLAALAGPG